jgi:hypothetical protein
MKQFHTMPFRVLSTLLLVATLHAFQTDAADKPAPEPPKEVSEASVNAAWQRRIAEYTADNLPLDEVVKYLQDRFPELNFHLKVQQAPDAAERVDLPAVSVRINRLRNVTLAEFLEVLELATDSPIQITGKPGDRLVVFDSKTSASTKPANLETRVFSLAKYLENRTHEEESVALAMLEDVLAEAGKMYAEASRSGSFNPRLNIHRGTKLLIVVGRPDELAVVEQIVRELQNPGGSHTVGSAPAGQPKAPAASGIRKM